MPTDYFLSKGSEGYSYLKLYCKKLSNQKATANTVSTTRKTTLRHFTRGEIKVLPFIKDAVHLPFSFQKEKSITFP